MLAKEYRLSQKYEFLKLKRRGQTKFTPLFNFSFLKANSAGEKEMPRFGFIASTHLDKRATVRNRAKRKVREAVRLFLKKNPPSPNFSALTGVFIIKREAVSQSYEKIELEVNKVLSEVFKF